MSGAYIVIADDGRGTAIKVVPLGAELRPGGRAEPAQTAVNANGSPYAAPHAALSAPLSRERIREIAGREGWQTGTFERGGVFELMEF